MLIARLERNPRYEPYGPVKKIPFSLIFRASNSDGLLNKKDGQEPILFDQEQLDHFDRLSYDQ